MSKPQWMVEAEKDLGLKEIPGKKHNPRVLEMFAQSGHQWVKDDETAWCAAAMNAWLTQAGLVGTKSLAARSFLQWGKSLDKKVEPGAIAVFKRGKSSWQGHVGICTGEHNGSHVEVLGGNQRNAVNVSRYRKADLLDTRWPSTVGNSRTVKAQVAAGASAVIASAADVAEQVHPIADQFTSLQTVKYVAMACVVILAIATIVYRLQDQREKGR